MTKKIELDVDFIGGGPTPTKKEFLAISEYLKATKANRKLKAKPKTSRIKRISKRSAPQQ